MPRTLLLALSLTLLVSAWAVAGPPEKVSGEMVFDEVADGLQKYRKEKDTEKRIALLTKLAPSRDPRVAVTLWELWPAQDVIRVEALNLLTEQFVKGTRFATHNGLLVGEWWEANGADLRRRAKELP